jgi:hypothetical protein
MTRIAMLKLSKAALIIPSKARCRDEFRIRRILSHQVFEKTPYRINPQ